MSRNAVRRLCPQTHTHMTYTLSPNAQRAIASLRTLSPDSLDRFSEWCEARQESATHGLLRADQAYDQRLEFLHQLMDVEAVWQAVLAEYERRSAVAIREAIECN